MTPDLTPCYVSLCKECRGVFGAAVADLNDTACMQQAVNGKAEWEKRGLVVETQTVQWFRDLPKGSLRHRPTCSQFTPEQQSLVR